MYGRHGPRHDGRVYKSGGRFRGRSRTGRGGRGTRAQQQTALAQQAALRAAREQARVLQGLLDASKETLQELSEKHSATKASNISSTARSRQVGESPSRHDHKVPKPNVAAALKAAAQNPTVLASAATGSLSASEGGSGPICSGPRNRARAPMSLNDTAVSASAAPQQKAERRSDSVRVTMTTTMAGVRGGGGMEQGHVSGESDGAACGAVNTDRVLQEVLAWADTYQRQVAEGSADIFAGLLGEPAAADYHSELFGVSLEPWLRKGGQAVDVEEEEPESARSSKRQRGEEVREAEQSTPSIPYNPSHGPLKFLDSSSSRQLWPNSDAVVCPYDLHGTCNDEECAFMHLSRLSFRGTHDNKRAKGAVTTPAAEQRRRDPRPCPWQWKPSVTLPAFKSSLLTGRGGVNHGMVVTMETGETGGERREQKAQMEQVSSSESDDEGRGLWELVQVQNDGTGAEGSDEEMSYLPLPQIDDEVEHEQGGMEGLLPPHEQDTHLAPTTTTVNGPGTHHVKPEQQAVRYFSSLSPSQSPVSAPPPTLSDLEHRVSTHPHDVKAWLSLALATLATSPPTTNTSTTPPPSPSNRRSSSPAGLHLLSSPEHVSVWLSAWLDNGPPDPAAVRPVIRLLARALDALAGRGGDKSGNGVGDGGVDSQGGERAAGGGDGDGDGYRGGAASGVEDANSVERDAFRGLSVLWLLYLRLYTSLPLPSSHIRSTTAHEAVCTQQPGSLPLWLLSESMTRTLAADLPCLLTYYQSSITHLCSLPPDPGSYGPPLAFLTVRYAATLLHSGHDQLACRAVARVLGMAGDFSTAVATHAPLPELPSEPLLPSMSVSSASLLWAFYLYLLVTGDTSSTLLSLASCPPSLSPEHAAAHTPSTWSVAWGWRTRLRLAGDRAPLDSLREAFTCLFTWLDSDNTSLTDAIDGGSDSVIEADDAEDLWIAVLEWNHDLLCDLWGGQRRGGPLWWRWGLGSMYTWTTAVRQARESWQVTWVDDLASWALSAAASPWRDGAALACTCEWLCDGADNASTLAKTRGLLVALTGRGLGRDGYGAGSLKEGVTVEAHRLVREADTDDQDQRLFRIMIEVQVTRVLRGSEAAGRFLREAIAVSCVKAQTPLEPMHRAQLWLELLALSPTADTVDAALCDVSSMVDMSGGNGGMGLEEAVEWSLSTRVMGQAHAHHACAALMSAVMSLHTVLCHTTLDRPTGPVPPSLLPLLARALIPQAVNRPSLTPALLRLRSHLRGALMATTSTWSRRDRCSSLSPHGPRSSVKSTCGMLAQTMALTELALGEPGRAQKALESALALEPWHVGVWEFLLRLQAAFSTPQRVEQVTRVMLEQAVSPVNLRDARTRS